MSATVSPRGSQLRIAYSPTWKKQSAFGTPLANGDLTAVFQARTPGGIQITRSEDIISDCTGQYTISRQELTRVAKLSIELDADAGVLGGITAMGFGVAGSPSGGGPYTNPISMLGPTVFDLPVTTLIYGFNDGDDPGVKLQDVAVNSFEVVAAVGERTIVRVEFVFNANLIAAAGFSYPACTDVTPLRMVNGDFTYNSLGRLLSTPPNQNSRQISFRYDNGMLIRDDPFTIDDPDITRLERADKRTYSFSWKVGGRELDTLHTQALASRSSNTKYPLSFRVGSTTSGVTYTAPETLLLDDEAFITFEGEGNRAVCNYTIEPTRNSSDSSTPLTASAVTSQSGGYLG